VRAMLAATYRQTGASDVLQVEEVPTPEPGPGEVRVRLRVSGVNPTDVKSRAGTTSAPMAERQIPGQDGAGEIDAVGPGVDRGRIGERVWVWFAARGRPWGTAAQYTVLPAAQAVGLPDGAPLELGAALGIPALTAHRCLTADGPVAGRAVLVAAGAGAVGRAAIELAVWMGAAPVVATASSPQKAQLAREAGASAVVDYREQDAGDQVRAVAPDGVERIVEVDLDRNLELDLAAAAPDAAIATYSHAAPGTATVPVRRLMTANIVLRFVLTYTMPQPAKVRAIEDVSAALRDRALTPPPLHRFPLERVADAHDALERGLVGKVVIDLP
jgi:NADPH:quinone reductase